MRIPLGFILFLVLYGLLHFNVYRRVRKAFNPNRSFHILLILLLLLLLFSPILTRMLPENDGSFIINAVTSISFLWMVSIFFFFSFYILIDLYHLILHVSARIFNASFLRLSPDRKVTLITVLAMIIFINLYGWFEAGHIRTEWIILNTDKLPYTVPSFRIVQISDTHFGQTNNLRLALKITRTIDDLEPDLLVSTGDVLDDGLMDKGKVEQLFRDLNVKCGKFASTGNHDFIAGNIENAAEFMENSGFRLLRNESVMVTDFLSIAAVDDPRGISLEESPGISEEKILADLSPNNIRILLKHRPSIDENSIGKFDLQLSGHTHKGQIFPWSLIVSLFHPYMSGLHELGKGSFIYVNRGAGTWGPPIRFLAPPEITVIEFERRKS